MSDFPIIFSAPMIRALIEGHKTMTRRLVPYGSVWMRVLPGDRLWVRENFHVQQVIRWAQAGGIHMNVCVDFDADGQRTWVNNLPEAGAPKVLRERGRGESGKQTVTLPSIHLPRIASRLTLEVKKTKLEWLQEITDADAAAEGIVEDDGSEPDIWYVPGAAAAGWKIRQAERPSLVFPSLWNAVHGKRAWSANPEVVALTFAVHQQNIDALARAA
jgi:hypothetical protein